MMPTCRRGRRRLLGTLCTAVAGSAWMSASADDGADGPPPRIRLVVAYPVGGLSSEVARALGEALAGVLSIPVVLDHRPGAGGTLAIDAVAKADADGSVLGFSAITPLTLAPLMGRVPYDAERDLAPVLAVMRTPVLIVGTPALPVGDMAAMLAWARASTAGVRWASSGVGTTGHMVIERVARAAGIRVTHVPYSGGGQQLSDAIGGQFELLSTNAAPTPLRYVRHGRLVPLAVTGPRRLPGLPTVPTLIELGLAQADLVSTFGVFAPAGLRPARMARLNAALAEALRASGLQATLAAADNEVLGGTPQDFSRLIAEDRAAHRAWLTGRL